ncbi:unnamed protein product [Meloidogyne enterolobii]|uniref:Uncharacterized protein n=1 Tax=Meloidogyne enterolobii TaxID=390850 RepID=A0ACB0ZI26_MELEN
MQDALYKHLQLRKHLSSKPSITFEEKWLLRKSEAHLNALKREWDFYSTGICSDMVFLFKKIFFNFLKVLHSILLVLACQHVRFHCSLNFLEERLAYTFKNRSLLELALIHPSFRANYGTNSDHAKNVLNNCGLRIGLTTATTTATSKSPLIPSPQNLISSSSPSKNSTENSLELLTKQQLIQKTGRRRGINVLMEIMSMQRSSSNKNENNKMKENNGGDGRIVNRINESIIKHNERLEFLGDAVVEFLTTIHLFFLFTELDEGGLATFRSALVQNRHLATLGDRLGLQHFMVYAHGPDLCHSADLRHAMANTFEALMAAVFLDSGLEQCDKIFANALFINESNLLQIWTNLPEHPLKKDTPYGDRHLISSVPCLKLLVEFERCIGITFKHIRLLAKAFTRRNVPYNFLTLGHNQRLEFLGDTILQLLTSEYLYKQFPYHQEGHLSLLRTCLVQATTQAVVCDDLAMVKYLVIPQALLRKCPQPNLRTKDKADLVEAFLGALYVDRGLLYCRHFCRVCFFPGLKVSLLSQKLKKIFFFKYFILSQRWNDPKSQLQQSCLTLRNFASSEPDIPEYKTIGIEGPTNTRIYRVAVYFRNKRLAVGTGASMHLAQMKAAENALIENSNLFKSNGYISDNKNIFENKSSCGGGGGNQIENYITSLNKNNSSTPLNFVNNRKRRLPPSFQQQQFTASPTCHQYFNNNNKLQFFNTSTIPKPFNNNKNNFLTNNNKQILIMPSQTTTTATAPSSSIFFPSPPLLNVYSNGQHQKRPQHQQQNPSPPPPTSFLLLPPPPPPTFLSPPPSKICIMAANNNNNNNVDMNEEKEEDSSFASLLPPPPPPPKIL